jgi:hypothetical protein
MDGISATLNQSENAFEPSGITWNAESGARGQTMGGEPHDVRQLKILEPIVVRDVQKAGVKLNVRLSRSWHSSGVLIVSFLPPS